MKGGFFFLAPRPSFLAPAVLWRASPHCMVVKLVRSGRKQPQLFSASAGVRLATLLKKSAHHGYPREAWSTLLEHGERGGRT